MNIKNEKVNGDVQELTIEITKEDYAGKVEAALKKYRRTAQVPGFRVGNAPMAMIKKMYEKSAIYDEVNNMMSQELYKYLGDNKIVHAADESTGIIIGDNPAYQPIVTIRRFV